MYNNLNLHFEQEELFGSAFEYFYKPPQLSSSALWNLPVTTASISGHLGYFQLLSYWQNPKQLPSSVCCPLIFLH